MELAPVPPATNPPPQPDVPSPAQPALPSPQLLVTPSIPPVPPAAPAAGRQARLTLRRAGALTSESFLLGERVLIGRFDVETGPVDVDMGHLPEGAYLSRHHAEIWCDDSGRWFLKDLGSQNGTFVRPAQAARFQRVTTDQPVGDGDEIAFGNARFEFRIV